MKFFSIKEAVILVSVLQEKLIRVLVGHFWSTAEGCLVEKGHPNNLIHKEGFFCSYLITIESVIMAIAITYAFPAEEVIEFQGHHLDLVELELERLRAEESEEEGLSRGQDKADDDDSEESDDSGNEGSMP
eukprot:CAMPEP_0180431894 /NCGR_PEP_ID=MMETSP1036_2-20121128/8635_1 /TAXON_ID=632150 /ORGANISM="Azadinium spinosum, Strain 3D9" /LENGTH=130 /DNA_ID=CAMNT_0022437671 /DNA_START=290 /DNA_END=679 /DNA_ORIENTATION=+